MSQSVVEATITTTITTKPKRTAIVLAIAERDKQQEAVALPAKNMGQKVGNYGKCRNVFTYTTFSCVFKLVNDNL